MVCATILLPLENVGAVLGSGGLTIPRFPPSLCFARDADATFYSFILPISIIFAIAVSLIAIILWVVVTKVGSRQSQPKVRKSSIQDILYGKSLQRYITFYYSLHGLRLTVG